MSNTTRRGAHTGVALVAALFLLLAGRAQAATHIVTTSGFVFVPVEITIEVGDTVEWQTGGLIHTVTNGTGSADPDVGTLFDAPLDNANPVFSYTFTSPGDIDYYCRTHELFSMTGIVHVTGGAAVPMLPGGPALLLAALLAGSIPWVRRALRKRAPQP